MRLNTRRDFDVIILGSGVAGSMLGAILARQGFAVLILDSGVHPRFAVGESTIPQTSQLITLLGREYDVPELHFLGLGSPRLLREHVTRNCGIKRVFGFVYHRPGVEHDPNEAHQFGNVWRDENHFFRQDIDAYLLTTAIRYGAHAVQGIRVESIVVGDDGVEVVASGDRYTGRFVADGTGYKSVVADRFHVREEPCSLVARTRSIFTHMVDVKPFEDVAPSRMAHRWSQATLHHCFKRGWIWVIPFNNWDGAPNPLVSVGATVDERLHPEDPSASPEEEFAGFVEMFPAVSRQFATARLARPWVRTRRLQYFSTRTTGYRWALLSHAAGFIDPLFSRGLVNTVDSLRSLSKAIIAALRDDDFSESRFDRIDREQKRNITFADKIVAGSYIAWDDFELWNAWLRLWAVGVHDTESRLGSVIMMGEHSPVRPTIDPIASEYEGPQYRALFEEMWSVITRYDAGTMTLDQARGGLWRAVQSYEFSMPLPDGVKGHEWAMTHPQCRDLYLGIGERHERWVKRLPDAHLAEHERAGAPVVARRALR
ncbi:MAG: NAD(P)/FAD-dependent oxidoreductase [Vicinamibacterales bacterium]